MFYSKLPSYIFHLTRRVYLLLVMCSLNVYHMCAATQEQMSDPLELELEVVVSYHCEWWKLNSGSVQAQLNDLNLEAFLSHVYVSRSC